MLLQLSERDRKTLTKLYSAAADIGLASQFGKIIIKRKLYDKRPFSRGTVYAQQAAFVTGLVTSYGRAFSSGRGGYQLPKSLVNYDADEAALHARLLDLRNKVYAHSDEEKWSVRPWHGKGFSTIISGQPEYVLPRGDIEMFLRMSAKLLDSIRQREQQLLQPYKASESAFDQAASWDVIKAALETLEVGESLSIPIAPDHSVTPERRAKG